MLLTVRKIICKKWFWKALCSLARWWPLMNYHRSHYADPNCTNYSNVEIEPCYNNLSGKAGPCKYDREVCNLSIWIHSKFVYLQFAFGDVTVPSNFTPADELIRVWFLRGPVTDYSGVKFLLFNLIWSWERRVVETTELKGAPHSRLGTSNKSNLTPLPHHLIVRTTSTIPRSTAPFNPRLKLSVPATVVIVSPDDMYNFVENDCHLATI